MDKLITTIKKKALPLAILLGAILMETMLGSLKSSPAKKSNTEAATLVDAITVKPGNHARVYESYGMVEPLHQYGIVTQVAGKIDWVDENLAAGARFNKDAKLFSVEKSDYEAELVIQQGALAKAEFDLHEEQGRQKIAQHEWSLLDESYKQDEVSRALIQRYAHLAEKLASVDAAQAKVSKAQVNLARTTITAPCNGIVFDKKIAKGQVAAANAVLIDYACTGAAQVKVQIPLTQTGSWPQPQEIDFVQVGDQPGTYTGLLQNVLAGTLMAQARVEFDNPQVMFGQYVQVTLKEKSKPARYLLDQSVLREGNVLWTVSQDNRLTMLPVKVISYQNKQVLIERLDGDAAVLKVITSFLSAPYEQQKVELSDKEVG